MLLVLLPVFWAAAQTDFSIGSIIKKFELPQRDKEGNLLLTILGREATVISRNRIKVDDLKIELYRNGKTESTIQSPVCDYWREEEKLTTESGVTVTHPEFTLTSRKMEWELRESRGDFKDQVRLEIKVPLVGDKL
ncbi:MAG: hypothetical protein ACFCUX_04785 [Candidatus Methylacidiphilales bacterium]